VQEKTSRQVRKPIKGVEIMEILFFIIPVWILIFVMLVVYSISKKRLKAFLLQFLIYEVFFALLATVAFPVFGTFFGFTSYTAAAMFCASDLLDWVKKIGEKNEK